MRQPRRVSRHLAAPAIRHPPRRALPVSRTRQGPLPVPHDTSRHDLVPATPVCPAGTLSPRLGGPPGRQWYASLRALPRSLAYGAFAMRRPPMLLLCSEALGQHSVLPSHAGLFVPATSPMATGDRGGTLPPRHHAGTNNPLSKALGATGLKAALAPRHYRISRSSLGTPHRECDVPRRARRVVTWRGATTPDLMPRVAPCCPTVRPISPMR